MTRSLGVVAVLIAAAYSLHLINSVVLERNDLLAWKNYYRAKSIMFEHRNTWFDARRVCIPHEYSSVLSENEYFRTRVSACRSAVKQVVRKNTHLAAEAVSNRIDQHKKNSQLTAEIAGLKSVVEYHVTVQGRMMDALEHYQSLKMGLLTVFGLIRQAKAHNQTVVNQRLYMGMARTKQNCDDYSQATSELLKGIATVEYLNCPVPPLLYCWKGECPPQPDPMLGCVPYTDLINTLRVTLV